jgi:hypothetical protein
MYINTLIGTLELVALKIKATFQLLEGFVCNMLSLGPYVQKQMILLGVNVFIKTHVCG